MSEQLDRLGRQLAAIEVAIAQARTEIDLERRDHLLAVADRASNAAREDYEEADETEKHRPILRLLKGGAGAIALPIGYAITRARKHATTAATAGATMTAAAVGAMVLLGNTQTSPAIAGPPPRATAQPSPHQPQPPRTRPPVVSPPAPAPRVHSAPIPVAKTAPEPAKTAPATSSPDVKGLLDGVPVLPQIAAHLPTVTTTPGLPPITAPTPPPVTTPPPNTTASHPGGLCLHLGLPPLVNIGLCLGNPT